MSTPIDFSAFLPTSPGLELSGLPSDSGAKAGGSKLPESASPAQPLAHAQDPSNSSLLSQFNFDPCQYGLDASAFALPPNGLQFSMPSFMLGGPSQPFSSGPAIMEAATGTVPYDGGKSILMPPPQSTTSPSSALFFPASYPTSFPRSKSQDTAARRQDASQPLLRTDKSPQVYRPDPNNPVYSLYGSSVVHIDPDTRPFANTGGQDYVLSTTGQPPGSLEDNVFDPGTLGLPTSSGGNFPGLYSSSGFDLMGVMARVAARPNPQINVGPVDTSCAFTVVDARKYDFPIVFASENFTNLTGYKNEEVIGRNCRFLQAPDGNVTPGSKRKYSDNNAVWHIKSHILAGKESQASIINYKKDGTPFINLLTTIPIVWDSDEIAYFVGFQVDLVQQPNAIMDKMRDGTYVVNYSLLPGASMDPSSRRSRTDDITDDMRVRTKRLGNVTTNISDLLDMVGAQGAEGLDDESSRRVWYRSIIEHCDDFVHVLSLKGAFLYASPGVERLLEYDDKELVGRSIASICHPSDSIPVMRELKESGNAQGHPIVSLLYRARRKHSGYLWLEAQGKLHVEQGKGRKCVILVGRERPTYMMSWNELHCGGGFGKMEFWSKLSMSGLCLYCTPAVQEVLGFTNAEMVGTSLSQLSPPGGGKDIERAITQAADGHAVCLKHQLKNRRGRWINVFSNFYSSSVAGSLTSPIAHLTQSTRVPTIVCQTNEAGSDSRRRLQVRDLPRFPKPEGIETPPSFDSMSNGSRGFNNNQVTLLRPSPSPHASSSGSAGSGPSTYSAVASTFKQLLPNSGNDDNVFSELVTTKTSSWQFELHQLKLTNKKLREEVETLEAAKKKRKRKLQGVPKTLQPLEAERGLLSGMQLHDQQGNAAQSPASSSQSAIGVKTCANCGRTDSPEWRKGPSGHRDLCNACGLRYSKAISISAGEASGPT